MQTMEPDWWNQIETLPEPQGASSSEDFWMFFAFALLMLVFVLTSYVNYLHALDVRAVSPRDPVPLEQVRSPAPRRQPLDVTVRRDGDTVAYGIDGGARDLDLDGLRAALAERLAADRHDTQIVNVHASGDVLYRHVFDAAYVARTATNPGTTPPRVRQIYEQKE